MSTASSQGLSGQFKESVDSAAETLKAAAATKVAISQEAGEVLTAATTEISKLAETMRVHAVNAANDAAQYARHELEAHPRASLAAAVTAVIAVIGVMAFNWRRKKAAS
jgi:hypothetical protein